MNLTRGVVRFAGLASVATLCARAAGLIRIDDAKIGTWSIIISIVGIALWIDGERTWRRIDRG
ncbi:protein of unknown function [Ralstonia solanacearum CMR15]|nr:protein of unknown function [Ralstonia solanacearum CMR15]